MSIWEGEDLWEQEFVQSNAAFGFIEATNVPSPVYQRLKVTLNRPCNLTIYDPEIEVHYRNIKTKHTCMTGITGI